MAYPWISASYTVLLYVQAPGVHATVALAQALYDHVLRNPRYTILAISYNIGDTGAVASIHYGEEFEETYSAAVLQAEAIPDWHKRKRGPVAGYPLYDLAIRSEFTVERTHVTVASVP
jgi:hypothetical protein